MISLTIPEQFRDDPSIVFVCNMSGGKDSTACALALREAEIPHRRVFADTGWEAPETYAERARRNGDTPGRYTHPDAQFFQTHRGARFIDEIVAWSRTERGGRQLPMFAEPPDGGCFRWGLCDAPSEDD